MKTASGATAVQIVEKRHGVRRIVAHIGSAHDEAELAVLMTSAREGIHAGRLALDPPAAESGGSGGAVVTGSASEVLWNVLADAYRRLGLTPQPLILRIDCGSGECAVHNADDSWIQPHPLTHDGATWRTSGPEEGQVYCNGDHVRGAIITLELTVVSADSSGGVPRAENFTGTLSVSAPATTTGCPAGDSQFAMTGSVISR